MMPSFSTPISAVPSTVFLQTLGKHVGSAVCVRYGSVSVRERRAKRHNGCCTPRSLDIYAGQKGQE